MSKFESFKKSITSVKKTRTDADILQNIDSYVAKYSMEAEQKPMNLLNSKPFIRRIEIRKKPAKAKVPATDSNEDRNIANKKPKGILDMYRHQKVIHKLQKNSN